MMPPRSLAARGAVCCAVLLAVASFAGQAIAETTPYSNLGWGDGQAAGSNPFRGATGEQWAAKQERGATPPQQGQWQAAGASQSATASTEPVPSQQPRAKSSRWLLPNHQPGAAEAAVVSQRPSTGRVGSALATGTQKDAEPRQFTPPSDATELVADTESADQVPSVPPARQARAASPAVARAANTPAQTSVARNAAPQRGATVQSRAHGMAGGLHRMMDNWIKPVGYEMDAYVEGEYIEGDYTGGPAGFGSCDTCDSGCPTYDGACGGPSCDIGCGSECGCGATCGCEPGYCEPGCGCDMGCGCGCEPSCGAPCERPWVIGFRCGDPEAQHDVCVRVPRIQEMMIDFGVHGFKGPYDRTRDSGNFGFQEGINIGFKVPYASLGYQLGYQAVQSQLSGDKDTNIADPFTQQFVTAGLFRRARCGNGWQGGAVWDMLRDERWDAVDFHQVRAELSYLSCGRHEFGFWSAIHASDYEFPLGPNEHEATIYQAADQYALFYRFHGKCGGEGRFYGGVTDDSDGIIGGDMLLPLQDRWSLQTSFAYLIPDEDGGTAGASQEAWNLSIGLVWHWDFRARRCHSNYYRPLFDVADNGWMIIDDRP